MSHRKERLLSTAVLATVVAGIVLLAWGIYSLVRLNSFGLLSPVPTAYLAAGLILEVAAATTTALSSQTGRLILAGTAIAFLQVAFLWTCGLGLPFTNYFFGALLRGVEDLNLTFLGTISFSFESFDLIFLFVLSMGMVSIFLLSNGRRTAAVLNSILFASALLAELSLMVYLFVPVYMSVPFSNAAPVWLTNYVLGVLSVVSLAFATCVRLQLRRVESGHRGHLRKP